MPLHTLHTLHQRLRVCNVQCREWCTFFVLFLLLHYWVVGFPPARKLVSATLHRHAKTWIAGEKAISTNSPFQFHSFSTYIPFFLSVRLISPVYFLRFHSLKQSAVTISSKMKIREKKITQEKMNCQRPNFRVH